LVGLALLASSGRGDIRDIGPITRATAPRGMFGRLMAAMKGGF
jgi:cell division protein FtsA